MATQNFKVYKGQDLLRLELDTMNSTVSSGTAVIKYTKPNGATGTFNNCTISGTKVIYEVQPNEIDEDGTWQFQPVVTVNGRVGPCDSISIKFSKQLF